MTSKHTCFSTTQATYLAALKKNRTAVADNESEIVGEGQSCPMWPGLEAGLRTSSGRSSITCPVMKQSFPPQQSVRRSHTSNGKPCTILFEVTLVKGASDLFRLCFHLSKDQNS